MEYKNVLSPGEIAAVAVEYGVKKVKNAPWRTLILAILAGAFIAFASEGSNMAAFNLLASPTTYGLGRALAGAVFGTGLMLVVLAGGELFTGNCLILTGVLERKIRVLSMLRNLVIVYIGNFLGSVLVAYFMSQSGLFSSGAGMLGAVTVKMAATKAELPFGSAFILGILCNWLVCLAVWMSYGAKDMTGKILAIFFPIWLFITSGFEHSVANMYYIPAGIFAKDAFSQGAQALGASAAAVADLGWGSFLLGNLLPVTLGNIVGGGLFVAGAYWLVYLKKGPKDRELLPDSKN